MTFYCDVCGPVAGNDTYKHQHGDKDYGVRAVYRAMLFDAETEIAALKEDVARADLRAEEYRRRAFAMLRRVRELKGML